MTLDDLLLGELLDLPFNAVTHEMCLYIVLEQENAIIFIVIHTHTFTCKTLDIRPHTSNVSENTIQISRREI